MKTFKYLTLILAGFFLATACQKELSQESGLTGGLATGTLRDSLGNCQPISVNGNYLMDTALNANNYVYVQLDITAPGVYRITTDTVNGFMFKDSGYFPSAGPQTVKLTGVGTPTLPIPTLFTVFFGTSQCDFLVNVTDSAGGGGGNTASFTFDNSSGACANPVLQGTYQQGTPLTAANTVTLSVDVTNPGAYNISTLTVNGFSFRGSGTFAATGPATIVLTATGTPTAGGTTPFAIASGTSGCAFSVPVNSGTGPNAVYTVGGSGGACTGSSVQGTYTSGTALTAANKITIQVNVTTAGAYNMTSFPMNGMTFSAAGNFATTGMQNVVLQGTGTPVSAGTSVIAIAGGSSGCTVDVTVTQGANQPTAADSAWRFSQGGRLFYGPVDTAYTASFGGITLLSIEGHTYKTDSSFVLDILLPGNTITTGPYSTANGSFFTFENAMGSTILEADQTTAPGATMNIVITAYNTTTRIVTGTFSGTALNASGTAVPVTGGTFRARVGP